MTKAKKIFLLGSIFLLALGFQTRLLALSLEYLRNGECYLLVGHDDITFRGVYRLNNPANESDGNPVGVKLYDPKNSYGISVNLNRDVFTFSENTDPSYTYDANWQLQRLLKAPGGVSLYGAHCDTRKSYYVSTDAQTYNESNKPVYTTTGPMGNETGTAADGSRNISWEWSGTVSITEKQAARWKVKKTFVKCDSNCTYSNGLSDEYWLYFVNVDGAGYGSVPNGAWWQSRDPDPSSRPGNLIYWDRAFRKYTYYDLNKWNKPMGVWSPGAPIYAQPAGPADSVYEETVKRSRISACLNCFCVNGSADYQFPQNPKYVSLALSPFGRMYLYTRTQNSASDGVLKVNGAPVSPADPNIRGLMNDLTTKWVGVSAISTTGDYMYILGTRVIKDWLQAYNINVPPTFQIDAITVSDQWWLEGGIVYAYDSSTGDAFQFIRYDKNGANTCKSTPKKINLGTGVDDIKADGFGNVYFSKTTMEPSNSSSIGWSEKISFNKLSEIAGRTYGQIKYAQKVFKTAYKRELGSSSDGFIGKIWIGNNVFQRTFSVISTDWPNLTLSNLQTYSALPTWQWQGNLESVSIVTAPNKSQLGVINVSTPPVVDKPNGDLGRIDIVGKDLPQYPLWVTQQVNQGLYEYYVENSPYWEGRSNQAIPAKSKWYGDVNGNGFEGGFVSSIVNTSAFVDTSPEVLYTFRIYKTQDAFGLVVAPPQLVKEVVDSSNTKVKYYFRSGVYQIECSAKFKWYNYDALPFGSTVNDLPTCLRPTGGAYETAVAQPANPAQVNTTNFPGLKPIPADTAVSFLKVNTLPPPPSGTIVDIQKFAPTPLPGLWKNPSIIGSLKYHVASESESNSWRIDGVLLPNIFQLPVISDSNMVPGTLQWQGNMPAQFDWAFNLKLPDGTDYPAWSFSKSSIDPNDTAIPFSLNFPTDPVVGSLTCKAYRDWKYDRNVYDDDGYFVGQESVEGHIEYNGEVGVLVLDTTPPQIYSVCGITTPGNIPLYRGTTYGLLTSAQPVGHSYSSYIPFRVRDNNMYGNLSLISPIPEHRHDRGVKQRATFYFERGSGKSIFPNTTTGADFDYYSSASPGVDIINNNWITQPAFKLMREPQAYTTGNTYTEVQYVINISDITHLQPNTVDPIALDYCTRLPVDFANNSANYSDQGAIGTPHNGYALVVTAEDSSGNKLTVNAHLGNVEVKDTLRPTPFILIRDYINSFSEKEPFGIDAYFCPTPGNPSKIIPSYHLLPNSAVWTVNSAGNYSGISNVFGIPWNLSSPLGSPYHPPLIQEGMEVFMTASASDNIGLSTVVSPAITVTGPSGLYCEGAPPQVNLLSNPTTQQLRALLQRSGVYNLTLTAQDNAKDYDGTPTPNTRTTQLAIVVSPVKMDIRVLEKKNERE